MNMRYSLCAACVLAGLTALLAAPARSEDKQKDRPAINVPAIGSRVTIELADRTQITGKLVSQQNGQIHLFSGTKLLVIALADVSKLTPQEPSPAEKERPAKPIAAPAEPTLDGVKADPKPAAQPAQEEEDVDVQAKAPEKPADPEKAVLKNLGLGQPKNNAKRDAEALDKNANPARPAKDEKEEQEYLRLLDTALELLDTGKYAAAVQSLRRIVRSGQTQVIEKAEAAVRVKMRRSLAETMALCYMQERCEPCKGTGLVKCGDCGGAGYVTRNITRGAERLEPGTHRLEPLSNGIIDTSNTKTFARDQLCAKCRGHGFDPCVSCRGTKNRFVEPTPYERSAYADLFVNLGNQVARNSEASYGDTGRSAAPTYETRYEARLKPMLQQVWLRDTANQVKSDIQRLWRAHQYYEWALKADPTLVFRSTEKDYPLEITKIDSRLHTLYGEFGERQQVYMSNRMENRLDEMNYYEYWGHTSVNGSNQTGGDKFRYVIEDQ